MEKILTGVSDDQKGAYLAAIASIATADTEASQTELEYLAALCEAADLPEAQHDRVVAAAKATDEQELVRSLDTLKSGELKYSLVTDLFAFAKSDGNYSEKEQQSVHRIATYLGVDDRQYELLGEVADKTNASQQSGNTTPPPETQSFFGMGDKLKESGINASSLLKGLITIGAPLILAKMMGRRSGGIGGLGGSLGGGGGLGSLIGMLSGGRGMGSLGGLLGKMFR